jgi:hypothetical protein
MIGAIRLRVAPIGFSASLALQASPCELRANDSDRSTNDAGARDSARICL